MLGVKLFSSQLVLGYLLILHQHHVYASWWDDLNDMTFRCSKFGAYMFEDMRSRIFGYVSNFDGSTIFSSLKAKIKTFARINPSLACIGNTRLCCHASWKGDVNGLEDSLKKHLHGQHLVNEVIIKAIKGYLRTEPRKALTLSFHGWTGGGKNFVSKMIAQHLFRDGMSSPFVHLFLSTLHFPHEHKVSTYKDNLVQWIKGNVSECGRSMFIFDEMDKMPPGLLDSIKSFLDYHASVDGYNFNRAIFIFISNTVGVQLTKVAINFWKQSKDRNEISLNDVNKLLQEGANNELSGLQHSSIVQNNLIDFYVPFLPLERSHIELCAKDEIERRDGFVTKSLLNEVANSLLYYPPNSLLYSTSGCKQVAQKVDLLIDNDF